jgi:hypothetical protein
MKKIVVLSRADGHREGRPKVEKEYPYSNNNKKRAIQLVQSINHRHHRDPGKRRSAWWEIQE